MVDDTAYEVHKAQSEGASGKGISPDFNRYHFFNLSLCL